MLDRTSPSYIVRSTSQYLWAIICSSHLTMVTNIDVKSFISNMCDFYGMFGQLTGFIKVKLLWLLIKVEKRPNDFVIVCWPSAIKYVEVYINKADISRNSL